MKCKAMLIVKPPLRAWAPSCIFYRDIELPEGLQLVPGMGIGDGDWTMTIDEMFVDVRSGEIVCYAPTDNCMRLNTGGNPLADYKHLIRYLLAEGWTLTDASAKAWIWRLRQAIKSERSKSRETA